MLSASGAGAIVAGSEFSFRWFSHRKKLSMSYDEARREAREQEGEPHLKAKRRGLHEELSRGAVLKGIRKAKVVIVEREKGVDRAR